MDKKNILGKNNDIADNIEVKEYDIANKVLNILAIDIDDSLLPNPNCCSWIHKEIALEQFSINLRKINLLLEATKSKIFIISSWTARFTFDDKNNVVKDKNLKEDFYWDASVILKEYLDWKIVWISSGNKLRDIKILEEKWHKVAIIDDTIFEDWPNSKFFETTWAITNRICWWIERYFNDKNNEKNI